ncbi:hypothetical protein DH2020_001941 [Rehmannia glutinosa]|uniref:Mitochondrial glycoprotein family protein n=1 Tax=Rehmannia glutinosa TaxID=99300 RepID=A0ABR0XSB8_REHGL
MSGGALINGCRRSLLSPCFFFKSISSSIECRQNHQMSNAYAPLPQAQTNPSSSSPFQSKLLRILSSEIQYQRDYAPPHQIWKNTEYLTKVEIDGVIIVRKCSVASTQPLTEFDRFIVEDRPGEQWIRLSSKSAEDENIKIEATMFDGFIIAQKSGDRGTQENVQLHISMSIDIWKGEGTNTMKFVCSAWPDSLEIQKVFMFRHDEPPARLYMGPHFKNLNSKLQTGFYQFLNSKGVNDGLSKFLHKYMMNKDRVELIQWLGKMQLVPMAIGTCEEM